MSSIFPEFQGALRNRPFLTEFRRPNQMCINIITKHNFSLGVSLKCTFIGPNQIIPDSADLVWTRNLLFSSTWGDPNQCRGSSGYVLRNTALDAAVSQTNVVFLEHVITEPHIDIHSKQIFNANLRKASTLGKINRWHRDHIFTLYWTHDRHLLFWINPNLALECVLRQNLATPSCVELI